MQYFELNEKKKHGTDLFPFEYYFIEKESGYVFDPGLLQPVCR